MSSEVLVWLKPVPQEVHFEIKRNSTDIHISAFIIAFCLLIFMQKAALLMSFSAYLERHGLYLIHLEEGICVSSSSLNPLCISYRPPNYLLLSLMAVPFIL